MASDNVECNGSNGSNGSVGSMGLSTLASVRPNFKLSAADVGGFVSDPAEELVAPSEAFRQRALVASRAQVRLLIASHCVWGGHLGTGNSCEAVEAS